MIESDNEKPVSMKSDELEGGRRDPLFADLCNPALDARDALSQYRMALIRTDYRSIWHRLLCWCGQPEAKRAARALRGAEQHARRVAQRSEAHRQAIRALAAKQPSAVREQVNLLALSSDCDMV